MKLNKSILLALLKKYDSKQLVDITDYSESVFTYHNNYLIHRRLIEKMPSEYVDGKQMPIIGYQTTAKGKARLKKYSYYYDRGGNTVMKRRWIQIKDHPKLSLCGFVLAIMGVIGTYYFGYHKIQHDKRQEQSVSTDELLKKNQSDYNYQIVLDRSEHMLDIFGGKSKWITVRTKLRNVLNKGSRLDEACYALSFFGGLKQDNFWVSIDWTKNGKSKVLDKLSELKNMHFQGKNNLMLAITRALGKFDTNSIKANAHTKRIMLFFGGVDNSKPDPNEVQNLKISFRDSKILPEFYCLGYGIPDSVQGEIVRGVLEIKDSLEINKIGWNIFFCDSLQHIAKALDMFLLGKGDEGNYLKVYWNGVEQKTKKNFEFSEWDTIDISRFKYLRFTDLAFQKIISGNYDSASIHYKNSQVYLSSLRKISKAVELGRLKTDEPNHVDTILIVNKLIYRLDDALSNALKSQNKKDSISFLKHKSDVSTIRAGIDKYLGEGGLWQYGVANKSYTVYEALKNIILSIDSSSSSMRKYKKIFLKELDTLREYRDDYLSESRDYFDDNSSYKILDSFVQIANRCKLLFASVEKKKDLLIDLLERLRKTRNDLIIIWNKR